MSKVQQMKTKSNLSSNVNLCADEIVVEQRINHRNVKSLVEIIINFIFMSNYSGDECAKFLESFYLTQNRNKIISLKCIILIGLLKKEGVFTL